MSNKFRTSIEGTSNVRVTVNKNDVIGVITKVKGASDVKVSINVNGIRVSTGPDETKGCLME